MHWLTNLIIIFREILATGALDGQVRIFNIRTDESMPSVTMKSHTARVFNISWSPTLPNILASGSDDKTICIWDYEKQTCLRTLQGHSMFVRGLMWHPEIPYILISGSWDSTLKLWDTRTGNCLKTDKSHQADIYSITSDPNQPFLFATSSRDNTVRLWSLEEFAKGLQWEVLQWLANNVSNNGISGNRDELRKLVLIDPVSAFTLSPEDPSKISRVTRLSGAVSKRVVDMLLSDELSEVEKFALVFEFFSVRM